MYKEEITNRLTFFFLGASTKSDTSLSLLDNESRRLTISLVFIFSILSSLNIACHNKKQLSKRQRSRVKNTRTHITFHSCHSLPTQHAAANFSPIAVLLPETTILKFYQLSQLFTSCVSLFVIPV